MKAFYILRNALRASPRKFERRSQALACAELGVKSEYCNWQQVGEPLASIPIAQPVDVLLSLAVNRSRCSLARFALTKTEAIAMSRLQRHWNVLTA